MKGKPSDVTQLDPSAWLGRAIDRALATGAVLRAASDAEVVSAIAGAAASLADQASALGAELRRVTPARSGLSPETVEVCLGTTLAELRAERLWAALASMRAAHAGRALAPARVAGYVMAGNVFTASLRPLAWALLCRVPVVVKVSSRDEGAAALFARALALSAPALEGSIAVLRAERDEAIAATLASRVDVLEVWGSDATVEALRGLVPATTTFVPHGHGLGAIVVLASGLGSEARARELCERIATDAALYDQHGCLSPHVVLVERGAAIGGHALAKLLSTHGFAPLAETLPRGAIDVETGATQLQWRSLAYTRGDIVEGPTWAVTWEAGELPRASIGYRNLAVYEGSRGDILGWLLRFGVHLKALGVAGTRGERAALAGALPPPLAPRVSDVGAMQTPPLEASADGKPPWAGLVRLIDLD